MQKKAIFWFRQDLRTYDNTGFISTIEEVGNILPIFVLDKNLIPDFGGLEDKKFGFLRESLENLDLELKKLNNGDGLKVFYDFPENIIPKLVQKYDIDYIYANKSYSVYGKARDKNISQILEKEGKTMFMHPDFLLLEPFEIERRKVFTPFFKLWQKQLSTKDLTEKIPKKFTQIKIEENYKISDFIKQEKHPYFTLDFGKNRLENYIKSDYNDYRNDLDKDGTSKISPYLRFGIYSVRQIYNKAKDINEVFVSELAWREFWQHIDYYFPETKQIEFQENKRHIKWRQDSFLFEKWCTGETGYPIVDAAMKQLVETNWMHGRARMIVSSFLTKDLLIDWRLGEKFFKKHLLDYDENMNFGNWQWGASVGADPKPLRIFSPILQSQKFDPQAKFIKKYIPSLENSNLKAIHNPIENDLDYIRLIVNHKEAQREARLVYKGEIE